MCLRLSFAKIKSNWPSSNSFLSTSACSKTIFSENLLSAARSLKKKVIIELHSSFLPGDIDGILGDVNRVNIEAVILRHKNLSAPDSTADRQNFFSSFWVYLQSVLKSARKNTLSLPFEEATVPQPYRPSKEILVRRSARIAQFFQKSIYYSLPSVSLQG